MESAISTSVLAVTTPAAITAASVPSSDPSSEPSSESTASAVAALAVAALASEPSSESTALASDPSSESTASAVAALAVAALASEPAAADHLHERNEGSSDHIRVQGEGLRGSNEEQLNIVKWVLMKLYLFKNNDENIYNLLEDNLLEGNLLEDNRNSLKQHYKEQFEDYLNEIIQ